MRRIRARRTLRSALVLALLIASLLVSGAAAAGDVERPEWTWSSATHPAGSGATLGGSTGGGVWYWDGVYFVPGTGHMNATIGATRYETSPTGTGIVGKVSHTSAEQSKVDIGLVATGRKPLAPRIRVSDMWTNAPITDVAHNSLPEGTPICHSGESTMTQKSGGYRCGVIVGTCSESAGGWCVARNATGLGYGGDSSGPVWYYDGTGGVVLYGWVRGTQPSLGQASDGSSILMIFEPVWNLQNKFWSEAESWGASGFPTGRDPAACFVTTHGCVRS